MEEGTDSDGAGSPQPNSSDIEAGETDPEEGTDSDGAGTPQPNSLDKEAGKTDPESAAAGWGYQLPVTMAAMALAFTHLLLL
jgi:hypothetical protein